MAQWTNVDEANGAPVFTVDASTGRSGVQEYGNTVFGNTPAETEPGAASPGWTRVVKGTGRVTDILIVNGGIDYANTDTIEVGGDSGTITTDANGTIIEVDVTLSGDEIDEVPSVDVDTVDGVGAVFSVVVEGRIGRVAVETLVAMRGIVDP